MAASGSDNGCVLEPKQAVLAASPSEGKPPEAFAGNEQPPRIVNVCWDSRSYELGPKSSKRSTITPANKMTTATTLFAVSQVLRSPSACFFL